MGSETLPDYLGPGLKIVFVGTAPSSTSALRGHYFSHPTNSFWALLHESGLTDRRLRAAEDSEVLRYGLGVDRRDEERARQQRRAP
jgi:double-stranded uracil-DNA glycosylase